MKALNYFATIVFIFMSVISFITAILAKEYHLFFLTGIFGVLAGVARYDYNKCKKEEQL